MPESLNQKNIVHGSITAGGNVHVGDYLVTYHNYFAAQEVKIPHRLTNNIPTNADHILGRATELAQAKDHLAQHQATVLFNGIGGIGKTALASKYMALYGSEYKHLAWITVQSTLAEAFTNNSPLLASLQITLQVQDYIAAKQLDKAFEYLFHQLNLLERTLVVIDNANDLDDLDQYKNWFDTANCHFLITSRSQPSEWATVEVDSLPEDEAVALFRKLHPSVSADEEAIKNLLSKLFYHTLLIELVAKAGASTGIPFADLQNMIETQFIHHQSLNEAPIPTGKHGSVVATNLKKAKIEDYIWLIFSQVKGLDEESKQLLKAMALLPVATPFDLDFLKEHFAFFNIPNAVVHLDALIERGWLQKEQVEGQNPYFKMHPLIGDVVVEHLRVDVNFAEKYFERVRILIHYDKTNPNHILLKINKNKHLAERLTNLFFDKNREEVSRLFNNLNGLEGALGFYIKAVNYGELALQIAKAIFDENDEMIARFQNSLAEVYYNLGRYNDAAHLFETASEIYLKKLGEYHPSVAMCQSNLGITYEKMGKYDNAVSLLETALSSDIKNFGDEYPTVAIKQSNLGIIYQTIGNYDRAITLLEAALSSNIKNLGNDHPTIAFDQSNLGNLYDYLGNYEKAIVLLESALANFMKNSGEEHPKITVIQGNLANTYCSIGNYNRAANLLEIALENDIKNLGKEHPEVAIKQSNLSIVYEKMGKYDIAISLLQTALTSILQTFGVEHPNVAFCQNNLALIYINIGREEEAKALWQAAYNNFLKNFGAEHPHTIQLKKQLEI